MINLIYDERGTKRLLTLAEQDVLTQKPFESV